jgi:hypothetical protein
MNLILMLTAQLSRACEIGMLVGTDSQRTRRRFLGRFHGRGFDAHS